MRKKDRAEKGPATADQHTWSILSSILEGYMMKKRQRSLLQQLSWIALIILWGAVCAQANEIDMRQLTIEAGGYPVSIDPSKPGSGKFTFLDAQGDPSRPIVVWYYRPENLRWDHRIVFVMHGGGRNGMAYRYPWIDHAIAQKFLLVVPEFSREFYPDNYHYNYGNVATRAGEAIEEDQWTFSSIEHLFDYLKKKLNFKRETYCIYGHSAGAQFVHRMLLFKAHARIETAIAANAGWYTQPTFDKLFPAGLQNSTATAETQKLVLNKKLFVLLGDLDTNTKDPNLPRSPAAKAQGKHRFERGYRFYETALDEAAKLGMTLAWELRIAKNIGHSHHEMAEPAASLLAEQMVEARLEN